MSIDIRNKRYHNYIKTETKVLILFDKKKEVHMLEKDTGVRAIHIYSELNEQIDFVIVVSETTDMKLLVRIIDNAYEDWFDMEGKLNLQSIPVCEFISEMIDMAGIAHWIFYK